MKKRLWTVLLTLLLLFPSALAAGEGAMSLSPDTWGRGLPWVVDQAGILTDSEKTRLTDRAGEISDQYGCGVYIIILDDLENWSSGKRYGGLTPVEACAEELRTGYGLGLGPDHDCVLLLLSMARRDYCLTTYGGGAGAAFTDYGRDHVQEEFLDDFRSDDWYTGLSDYLAACELLLRFAAEGRPYDANTVPISPLWGLLASVVPAFLIAWVTALIRKSSMKETREQTEARSYIPEGGADIAYRYDRFTHATESRVYDPPASRSGGGGRSSHTSSSGHTHSSGKF